MGLESFKRYQDLCNQDYYPPRIGFGPKPDGGKVTGGDVNRLNARINLAKSFQGIQLVGISEKTVAGYDAFFQVFLTHSALEGFMKLHAVKHVSGLSDLLMPHDPEKVVRAFFDLDRKGKLCDFLCKHIDSKGKKIRDGLLDCKSGEDTNPAFISAAIRHIFAHGHLTANANGINPKNVNKACMLVSDFLLRFMDAEFTKTIDACYDRIAAKEAARELPPVTTVSERT